MVVISRFDLNTTSLGRTAPVVRDRRHVCDGGDLDAERVQRAHGRLAPRAGTLYADLEALDAALLRSGKWTSRF